MSTLTKAPQTEIIKAPTAPTIEEMMDICISSLDVTPGSRASYRRALKQYFIWIDKKGYRLQDMTRQNIIEYKEDLLASGMSPLSVGAYIGSVRIFYNWAEGYKLYPDITRGVKNPKRRQQFKKQPLSADQAKALLSHFDNGHLRDYAIVNLLLRTGLRTIEVVRADVGDITYKGSQRVLLIHGKGRSSKDDFVVLTDKAFIPIAQYLEQRGRVAPTEPLFASYSNNSKSKRLTTRTISYLAKEGLKAIGLPDKAYTAHSLRHTAAVTILRAGGSLETAQKTLRHTSSNTTQIYTATLDEERRLANPGEALIDNAF